MIFTEIDRLLDNLLLQGSDKILPEELTDLAGKCRRAGLAEGARLLEELARQTPKERGENYLRLAVYRAEWKKELNWERIEEEMIKEDEART
ncbi:MAG: hypothetical protein PQJ60_08445 [Spirochaetales bacterium]|nr:hypothetical protein [Spirochaetales bacterium]